MAPEDDPRMDHQPTREEYEAYELYLRELEAQEEPCRTFACGHTPEDCRCDPTSEQEADA